MALKAEEKLLRKQSAKGRGISEERVVKVVEEGLQHRRMELAATHLRMHPQRVMQGAEGVPTEEEEAEIEEEK